MIFIHSAILYFLFKGTKDEVAINDCDLLIFATAILFLSQTSIGNLFHVPLMSICL